MLNLIVKDIKIILYDKKTLAIILLMPMVLMMILGSALKGSFSDQESATTIEPIEVAIVKEYDYQVELYKFKGFMTSGLQEEGIKDFDLDEINPEKIFFKDFLDSKEMKDLVRYKIVDRSTGEQLLADNKISAMIILPKNFVYNTYINMSSPGRNTVTFEVIKKSENQFLADMIQMIMTGFSDTMNGIVAKKMVMIDALLDNNQEQRSKISAKEISEVMKNPTEKVVTIESKAVTGEKGVNSFQYYAVAIMTMFLLYAASIGGKALIEEKNDYTLQRLEVTGKTIGALACSNFFRIMAIAITQSIIMIAFSSLFMPVAWGDLTTMFIGMLSSAFAVGGLGALVSVITLVTDRYYVASIFEYGIVNLMALVGGSFIPVEILPKALQKINFIAINGNAIHIYLNGMKFRPISESSFYLMILFAMGLMFLACAFMILRSRKRRVIA